MKVPGSGLAKGLAVTMQHMTHRSVTDQYPDVKPELPPRSRGVIALVEENCTVCMLCARECPDWCIYIDSHKETIPAPEGGRERQRNVLDRFAIDFSLCMYCSICIEVCPFDALFWSPEFEYSEFDIRNLTHERERLNTWVATVPAPPAADPGADHPKEFEAAHKAAAKARLTPPPQPEAGASVPASTKAPVDQTPAEPGGAAPRPRRAAVPAEAAPAEAATVAPAEAAPADTAPADEAPADEAPAPAVVPAASPPTPEPTAAPQRRKPRPKARP